MDAKPPNEKSPSMLGMALLGSILIIASTIRLAAGTVVRSISGKKD